MPPHLFSNHPFLPLRPTTGPASAVRDLRSTMFTPLGCDSSVTHKAFLCCLPVSEGRFPLTAQPFPCILLGHTACLCGGPTLTSQVRCEEKRVSSHEPSCPQLCSIRLVGWQGGNGVWLSGRALAGIHYTLRNPHTHKHTQKM